MQLGLGRSQVQSSIYSSSPTSLTNIRYNFTSRHGQKKELRSVGLPTLTNASLVLDEAKPIHTIGEGKTPHFIAPGERKFDRGLERRGGRKGSGWI